MTHRSPRTLAFIIALIAAPLSIGLVGCDDAGHDHDHDHGGEHAHDDGHDHGGESAQDEGDVHKPSHGGVLIEIGDHFANIEVKLDAETGTITAWTTGPHADQPKRLKQESIEATVTVGDQSADVAFAALPNSITGEKVGDTSQFEAQADLLKGADAFEITFKSITVSGQTFDNVTGQYKAPAGGE